jgi:branched-chain amino acid transport system ATP-binding protein
MEHNDLLGGYPLTFILFTLVAGGWLAFMTGNALAATWRPMWQALPYAILLGAAERFFNFALFAGDLLSITGFLIDTALLMLITLAAYRATLARKMVLQYPWHYQRAGLFGWQPRKS